MCSPSFQEEVIELAAVFIICGGRNRLVHRFDDACYYLVFIRGRSEMLATILIVVVLLMLLGALPRWSHSRQWGYFPSGGLGLVLVILIVLVLLGHL